MTTAFGKFGKAKFLTEQEADGDPQFDYRAVLIRGGMDMREFNLYNWRGGGGSLWFAPVSQARGSGTLNQMALAKRILSNYGLDYTGEFVVGMRDMHHILDVLFDRMDPEMTKAAYQCFDELVSEFAARGYGSYRTNTAFMDKVADTFGPVQRSINQQLKRALDPNGILAPGKSGIR